MNTIQLVLHLKLLRGVPPAGTAVLVNHGRAAIKIWSPGTSFGDEALSFETMIAGRTEQITRVPQVYTVNPTGTVAIPRGTSQSIPFDLGDKTWQPPRVIEMLERVAGILIAVYTVPNSPNAARLGVWTGTLHSAPLKIG